jgi:hypothetical protein
LIHTLIEADFRLHIQPGSFAPQPFLKNESYLGMDLQLNIFGIRAGADQLLFKAEAGTPRRGVRSAQRADPAKI